jgi:3-dehydroquinate synthase
VNNPLSLRFGEYVSAVDFTLSIEECRLSADAGAVVVFDRNTARIQAIGGNLAIDGPPTVDELPPNDRPTSNDGPPSAGTPIPRIVLPPGEGSKSWSGARRILQKALSSGLGRDGLIVGIGGGMICDLASFAASLFMRGCRLVLIPTSLLAMVDAAIGGKTAINYGGYKNMVGTFYPAERICIVASVLRSLPQREFRSGLGEVIKTALLGDRALLETLSSQKERILDRDPALMEEVVRRCIAVKARIVEEDPRETGNRAFLNLGHTFAHAVEALTGYKLWSHGQAVAWGLVQAAAVSERLGLVDSGYTKTVRELVLMYGFDLRVRLKPESIVKAMLVDKKKRRGKLRLVLQRGIGDTVLREVDPHLVAETLRRSSRNFS